MADLWTAFEPTPLPSAGTVSLFVPCIPVPQPRQRQRIMVGKKGNAFAMNYTPRNDPVNDFKAQVRFAVQAQWQGGPWDCPVSLVAVFVFPRPKSLKGNCRKWHIKRPDADNVLKALKDSLKGMAWLDDSQVCEVCVRKWYAAAGEQPGVDLTIRRLS